MNPLEEVIRWTDWYAFAVAVVVGVYLIFALALSQLVTTPAPLAGLVIAGWCVTYIAVIEIATRMSP